MALILLSYFQDQLHKKWSRLGFIYSRRALTMSQHTYNSCTLSLFNLEEKEALLNFICNV